MTLDINYKKKNVKNTDTWRINNMFQNKQQVTEEIKREVKKFIKANDNENATTQNLQDTAKAVLRGSLQQYNPTSKNKKNIKQTTLNLKQLEKEEQNPPKLSEEIINI